jgi:carbamoyl-phosphate synthase large subunit
MKSTGETMGRAVTYSEALSESVCIDKFSFALKRRSLSSHFVTKIKSLLLPYLNNLKSMGYRFSATRGTADYLLEKGFECLALNKVHEGRPHCVDRIRSGEVQFVINTTAGRHAIEASFAIRRACTDYSIPCLTESDAAEAFVTALEKSKTGRFDVSPLVF